jgi:hypothetical protein
MKVLLFNIDHPYRSVYTGAIAAALKKKVPSVQITAFISGPNEPLETTGQFQKLYFFDTQSFFDQARGLSSEDIEQKMKKAVQPLIATEWDVVINLSSNLLGSVFSNFVNAREIRGPSMDDDFSTMKHSDQSAFLLANASEDFSSNLHFTYLYRSMLRRFEEVSLTSVWDRKTKDEYGQFIGDLKRQHGKSQIILIDTGLAKSHSVNDVSFAASLYAEISSHKEFLPVLLGNDLSAEHPLIRQLQATMKGEILSFMPQNKAQLSVISESALVITDDLYLKALSDISVKPSILLIENVNLEDYAVTSGSMQIIRQGSDETISSSIIPLIERALKQTTILPSELNGIDIYETINFNQLPLIAPVTSGGTDQYARWLLFTKFLTSLQNITLPKVRVNPATYKNLVATELTNIEKKHADGLYSLAATLSQAKIRTGNVLNPNNFLEKLSSFLQKEQAN